MKRKKDSNNEPIKVGRKKGDTKSLPIETIFEMRKKHYSINHIYLKLKEQGYKVCYETVRKRCNEAFNQRDEKQPAITRTLDDHGKIVYIPDEEIYSLRKEGKSCQYISNYFRSKGIKISRKSVEKRSKRIFNEKNEIQPNKKNNLIENVSGEELYKLKQKGLSIQTIQEELNSRGIKCSVAPIRKMLEKYIDEKGLTMPKTINKRKKEWLNEEIYELRKSGMYFSNIRQRLLEKNIDLGENIIAKRCHRIFELKNEEEPHPPRGRKPNSFKVNNHNLKLIDNEELRDIVLNRGKKRKATQEQLKKFAEEVSKMYNVKIDIDNKEQYENER